MLVNVELTPTLDLIVDILSNGRPSHLISLGYYQSYHFNFEQELVQKPRDEYPLFEGFGPFGVVDTVEQFDELFGDTLRNSPRKYVVSFVEIKREDQPASGGWRYHKWGEYYGTQEPQHEYLADDTHIDRVFSFHIYEVTV